MDNGLILCDQYLHDYFKIDPTINDFFLKDEWIYKRKIQPNIYSEKHYKDILRLNKKYLKYENKLNRITGKFTQLAYRKSGTLDYDPDTNTFASNYEFRNKWEYQCSKEDPLF